MMIKLKKLLNEKLQNSQGETYTFGKGDIVKDINPDCPHHGAEGEVTKGGKVKITFIVTNNGKNYKEGDKLEKTVDQMVKLKEGKLNEGKAFDRWRDHEISVQKLYRDTIWAQKNVPNKKKEVKMIQKLLKQLDPLVRVITGQTVDKK